MNSVESKLSKETIEKLEAVKAAILAEPELYDQSRAPLSNHNCNTPSCIFGWLSWLYSKRRFGRMSCEQMADLAGMTYPQFCALYISAEGWPEPFRGDYKSAESYAARAAVAAKRIDLFISSGGTR